MDRRLQRWRKLKVTPATPRTHTEYEPAATVPAGTSNETPFSTGASGLDGYAKATSLKVTPPWTSGQRTLPSWFAEGCKDEGARGKAGMNHRLCGPKSQLLTFSLRRCTMRSAALWTRANRPATTVSVPAEPSSWYVCPRKAATSPRVSVPACGGRDHRLAHCKKGHHASHTQTRTAHRPAPSARRRAAQCLRAQTSPWTARC